MSSRLISKDHHSDMKLELSVDGDEVIVGLAKNIRTWIFIQTLIILVFEILFVIHGISKGYLLKVENAVLVGMCLIPALVAPPIMHMWRVKQVGDYILKFDRKTRKVDGHYFNDLPLEDIDRFIVVSERVGGDPVYEIQIILKGNTEQSGPPPLLVYPSSSAIHKIGNMFKVFDEFAVHLGKTLTRVK